MNKSYRNRRDEMSPSFLLGVVNDLILDWNVTSDEKWIPYNNLRYSAQWLDCKQAPEHFLKVELHQKPFSPNLS